MHIILMTLSLIAYVIDTSSRIDCALLYAALLLSSLLLGSVTVPSPSQSRGNEE